MQNITTKVLALLGTLMLTLGVANAQSEYDLTGPYWKFHIGAYKLDEEARVGSNYVKIDDTGTGLGLAFGYSLDETLEVEIEYIRTVLDYEGRVANIRVNGEFAVNLLMFNAVFNADRTKDFTPYLGVGFGGSSIDVPVNANTTYREDGGAAYQIFFGVKKRLDDNIYWNADIRAMGVGGSSLGVATTGLQFSF